MPDVTTDRRGRHVIEFQLRGVRIHRRCPRGTTKAQAEALAAKIRHELFATRELGLEPTVDLPTAIATWLADTSTSKAADSRQRHAFALVDYVEGRALRDIPAIAETYREDARAAGLALATIDRRLSVLKAVAKWAWRRELIRENLSARIWLFAPNNARQRYESLATVRRLVDAMTTDEGRAWVALAAGTGMRAGELHAVRPEDVRDGAVFLADSKNGEPRIVPVAEFALPYLAMLPFTRTRDQLDQEWRRARAAAGVQDFRFHDLRHTFASLLINKQVPLEIVGKLLGNHPLTTRRYAHLYQRTLRAAVKKLG